MRKKAILYIRVSTDEQADKGYSLRYQEERLVKHCEQFNIEVVATFQDDYSAKTFDRPEFIELLASLKKKKGVADILLFTKWDRFSRNAGDAYAMINTLNKLGVEPQALEQPLDLNIPENKIMLAFYLASPEVENDRRALNTFVGMRRAKKEGRWVSAAPKGYKNARSDHNDKIIIPSKDAKMVAWIFEELATGSHTVSDIMVRAKEKGFVHSKTQFHLMLRNPVYCGLIRLPAYKEEDECLVKGSHERIISEDTFFQVQDFLSGKRRNVPTKNTRKDEFPLRGFLVCRKCGRMLTGSASIGKKGTRYFYYHCQPGCKERIKAPDANKEILRMVSSSPFTEESVRLYHEAIAQIFKENLTDKNQGAKLIKGEIDILRQRLNKAQNLMLDGKIDSEEYRAIKKQTEPEIDRLLRQNAYTGAADHEYKKYIDFGLTLLQFLPHYYKTGDVALKQALINSIFVEKLVFDETHYRTPKMNPAVSLICPEIGTFEGNKNGTEGVISLQSRMVARTGIEPVLPE
jgi:site-specific DNA recombinase